MINAIIEAISISLNAEFGGRYKIYREVKRQGLQEPCFFIQCLNPADRLFFGKRYFRRNPFCIQYFPEDSLHEKEECYAVAERLFRCLECLKVGESWIRGTERNYEVVDDILHFFVNYDRFVYKIEENVVRMDGVSAETAVKG